MRFDVSKGLLLAVVLNVAIVHSIAAQTPTTGALMGVILDPSGAAVGGVSIHLVRRDGAEEQSATSDENGWFGFLLLPAGRYELLANKKDFEARTLTDLRVHVTESMRIEVRLKLATQAETAQVGSAPIAVQVDTSALGRVVNEETARNLPLVTRNFTQIAVLSPGVTAGVYNAGELGTGATASPQLGRSNDGVYVHGARSYDNNWQLDGVSINDVQASGTISGGIPIPSPDTLEEFKVQTGLYDAAFGRGVGANVSVVTKAGTNEYHGSLFEFWRNNVLNANDFFRNETGQTRPDLKENQFGLAFGGPVRRDKLLFFGSYQGTRQINGIAAGQSRIACGASLSEPALTNDRSAQALGRLFGGMTGAMGGVAVNPDGSNINPVALTLLNFKLPDGSYLIPTPQTVNSAKPLASRGFSTFTEPCTFQEDQGLASIDYVSSPASRLTARLFIENSNESVTFPGGAFNPVGNIRGFNSPIDSGFDVVSIAHTYAFNSAMLNEARIGLVRITTQSGANAPFTWSGVGVSEGAMNRANQLPSLSILGSLSMSSAFPRTYTQNSLVLGDVLSWLRGAHSLKVGASLTRLQVNLDFAGTGSFVQFQSWPDFLLGLSGSQNGTGSFSNVFQSSDLFGLLNRQFRAWEGSGFVQDDYRIKPSLTLNLGVRYERIGQFGDALGRNASFDVNRADANPPPGGTLDGYIVASNFPGIVPAGVVHSENTFGNYGEGQNSIAPRIGFAWQILPKVSRLVLRGGYGIYYSRPTGPSGYGVRARSPIWFESR